MNTKKKSFSIKARITLIAVVPTILIGISILLTGIILIKSGMEEEVIKGLITSAYAYRDTGLDNSNRELGDSKIENELKENTGYDFTWFDGKVRKNSSLGKSLIGTEAGSDVVAQVIRSKEVFTSTNSDIAGEKYFVAYVPVLDSDGKVIGMAFCGVSRDAVESQILKSILYMLANVIILLIIIMALAIYIANRMAKPIKAISESVTDLANGEFVKIDKYLDRSDEIGTAIHCINNLVEKIQDVVVDIHKASEQVGGQSNELAKTSGNISQTIDGVSEAVLQIAKGATEQTITIQNAKGNINNLSDAIQNVASHSENLAVTAAEMNEAGQTSSTAIKNLSKEMLVMQNSVESITKTMNETNNTVHEVNKRTDNISNIASQTNLLALNASIEAARAGESGKGFAVVAEEIGKLAVEAATTAKEIREEMVALLTQSQDAKVKTDDISNICRNVIVILQDTESKISNLIKDVNLTVDGVTTISALTQECEAAKAIIIDAMSSLSAISEENAASTEETSASMHEVNSSVNLLAESSDELKDVAAKLEEELKFFKI